MTDDSLCIECRQIIGNRQCSELIFTALYLLIIAYSFFYTSFFTARAVIYNLSFNV